MRMDSIDLRPEELWGADEDEEDDLERELHRLEHGEEAEEAEEAPARHSRPEEAEAVDADALSSLQKLRAAETVKRRTLKPRPKLDSTLLMGDRGLTALVAMVKRQKWKGKGHERQDLATLMATYEHWGHRLFPKMRFDEITVKLEELGHKKSVQALVTKLRLDMPMCLGDTDPPPNHAVSDEEPPTAAWDSLHHQGPPAEAGTLSRGLDDSWEEAATASAPQAPSPAQQPSPASPALSQEQQARIAANRERAMALRRQRLGTETA